MKGSTKYAWPLPDIYGSNMVIGKNCKFPLNINTTIFSGLKTT